MYVKECPKCKDSFEAKDKRKVYCSQECFQSRELFKASPPLVDKLPFKFEQKLDLPDPDQLPAPYAKRVYDMWRMLIGEANVPTRIA